MARVELIYDSDCPNVERAREQLKQAFIKIGKSPDWVEWLRSDPNSPEYVRQYGSPTILVDGKDIASSASRQGAKSCRIYQHDDGTLQGVPSIDIIVTALSRKSQSQVGIVAVLPAIGVALMPKLVCPACWPAYAAIIGTLGLGFLVNTQNLFIASILFLGLALFALFLQGRTKRKYTAFWLGLLSTGLILIGKFMLDNLLIVYGGATLLTVAAVMDFFIKKKKQACPACETEQQKGGELS